MGLRYYLSRLIRWMERPIKTADLFSKKLSNSFRVVLAFSNKSEKICQNDTPCAINVRFIRNDGMSYSILGRRMFYQCKNCVIKCIYWRRSIDLVTCRDLQVFTLLHIWKSYIDLGRTIFLYEPRHALNIS